MIATTTEDTRIYTFHNAAFHTRLHHIRKPRLEDPSLR
jgi:hypothetical protein